MKKQRLRETSDFLTSKGFLNPAVGIVLGTGFGQFIHEIDIEHQLAYSDIPHFPESTAEFHSGKLIFGTFSGKKVLVMCGRFHLYEGYDLWEVSYGIRVMHLLGITSLLISNAAGAVNLSFKKGDLMLIDDHLNLQGSSPLAFPEIGDFGERFVDMLAPYSKKINTLLKSVAQKNDIQLCEGVYAGVFGPQLETRAEYRMLQILEADAVGMSTIPEVIVANHLNLPCAAISILTDECDPKNLAPVNIEEIIQIVKEAEPKMILLFKELIPSL